jgi:hypothetical protein
VGPLTLPPTGSVYLDMTSLIYSVERTEPYRALLQPVWDNANPRAYSIVTSELTLLESLVKPFKTQDQKLVAAFRAVLLGATDVQLIPITRQILERAARLRATTSLKTPMPFTRPRHLSRAARSSSRTTLASVAYKDYR